MSDFKNIVQYIRKVYNKEEGFIPLHVPVFNGNEKKYIEQCIDTTFVSSVGKFVDEFELKIAEYTGAKRAIACVNGTNALHIALKIIGVDQGHEVITQSLTFIATVNAISYCNAHPVFLDVEMETMGLSPTALTFFLKNHTHYDKNTKQTINNSTNRPITACVPMHTFGNPCRVDEIVEICSHYQIPVVEDAAESLGSTYKSQHTGTFGKIGVLSFNGNKIITTGGGGMLLFQDEVLANHAKHLTTQAKLPHPWEFAHDEIGYNYRMPNINAAIGLAQLEQLDGFLNDKRKTAESYMRFFEKTDIDFFSEQRNARSNYWLNCILFKNKAERDEFLKFSNENGVMTRPAWQLLNSLPMFKNCYTDDLKNSTKLSECLVNIPSSCKEL